MSTPTPASLITPPTRARVTLEAYAILRAYPWEASPASILDDLMADLIAHLGESVVRASLDSAIELRHPTT
jgi:hypothetical protein